jgi:hypothetical protein
MKTRTILSLLLIFLIILTSCEKSIQQVEEVQPAEHTPITENHAILIDASKDGGPWWFPQSAFSGFSENQPHQGRALANYLRGLGFVVDELPIGAVITPQLLMRYTNVIRPDGFYNYTAAEVAAYDSFLSQPHASLLLMNDHMKNTSNDRLSIHLGVDFAGAAFGTITGIRPHVITQGVTSVPYNAGCAIVNHHTNNIIILGSLDANAFADINNSGTYDAGDIIAPDVMGILKHPTGKIFLLADVNGLETVPQPFTRNLADWLFY